MAMEILSGDVDAVELDGMEETGSEIDDWRKGLYGLLEVVKILNGTMEGCWLGGDRSDSWRYDWTAEIFDCTGEMLGQDYWWSDSQRRGEVMGSDETDYGRCVSETEVGRERSDD